MNNERIEALMQQIAAYVGDAQPSYPNEDERDHAPSHTLQPGEAYPFAAIAFDRIRALTFGQIAKWSKFFHDETARGNRSAAIAAETLRRIMVGEVVSDRYVLGLYALMVYTDSANTIRPTLFNEE